MNKHHHFRLMPHINTESTHDGGTWLPQWLRMWQWKRYKHGCLKALQGRLLRANAFQLRKQRKTVFVVSQVTLFIIRKASVLLGVSLRLGVCRQSLSLSVSLVVLNDNVYALILQNIHRKTFVARLKICESFPPQMFCPIWYFSDYMNNIYVFPT